MTNKILWIKRILAFIFYCVGLFVCEKFKLPPMWCFILGIGYIVNMSFLFAIIEELLK